MSDILNPETELLSNEIIKKLELCKSDGKMKHLLKNININGKYKDGKTLLMYLIQHGFINSANYLIDQGADVSEWYVTKDSGSIMGFKIRSALTFALRQKKLLIFNKIIEKLMNDPDTKKLKDNLAIARLNCPTSYDEFLESIRVGWSKINDNKPSGSSSKRSTNQAKGQDKYKFAETIDTRMKYIRKIAKDKFDNLPKKSKGKGKRKKGRYNIKF